VTLIRNLARGWRTGLSGPVIVLQAGTAVNFFGYGLILPFEIIYLHQARGFPTATAGLVLGAVMGTAAVATPPSGALVDRFRAKPILIAGSLASGLGYGGFAFVDRPWQAFVCAAVGGAGLGVTNTASRVLSLTLVTAEQRASLFALGRVAGNFGIGSGATVAGFIVASVQHLRAFQALYLLDAITCAALAKSGSLRSLIRRLQQWCLCVVAEVLRGPRAGDLQRGSGESQDRDPTPGIGPACVTPRVSRRAPAGDRRRGKGAPTRAPGDRSTQAKGGVRGQAGEAGAFSPARASAAR
jgi:MFS family permease